LPPRQRQIITDLRPRQRNEIDTAHDLGLVFTDPDASPRAPRGGAITVEAVCHV
jgi:hypothetical protein